MGNSPSRSRRSAELLLIEDNPGDVRLIEEAFRDSAETSTLHVVSDGDEALDFCYQRGDYATAPRPDLVLLDWNLPRTNGKQVLQTLKDDPTLKHIPITILTGSQDDTDVIQSYQKHANACLEKAVEPDEFMDAIRVYIEFWLSTARLPAGEDDD